MKIQELNRKIESGEVRSTYAVGNLIVSLTSRFSDKVSLEDEMYQIVLQRLRSQNKSEGRQNQGGHRKENVV